VVKGTAPLVLVSSLFAGCSSVHVQDPGLSSPDRAPSDGPGEISSRGESKPAASTPGAIASHGAASKPASKPAQQPEVDGAIATSPARKQILDWETGEGKSYLIPALDIVGFEFLLNQFNRHFVDEDTYGSDLSSIRDNLQRGWVIDHDPFATNQFLHPYQGSIYNGFARSAGLNSWEALGYDLAGSTLWEVAGETDPPSLNDEITTTFGGSFLGEALFRMSNLVLESDPNPGFWTRLGAGLISPSSGFNRLAFGERFDTVYDSNEAATFWKASIGARHNARLTDFSALSNVQEDEAIANVWVDYGLPGNAGYEYKHPFDYFHFSATLTSSAHAIPENISVRGLLVGSDYKGGDDYRGVWGLYGGYDYFSPELFSVSSTALSLGTTGQYRVTDDFDLQGTVLGGVGWTAVGTIADAEEDRDYRYGYSPQALIDLRTIFGERVLLDVNARDYYIDGQGAVGTSGGENILRAEVGLTVRVWGHHAIGLEFVVSRRDSTFSDVPDALQEVGALSLVYTYLGDTKLGAVRY
jgi:hypothetical protein